jgi:hypothetical protein
MGKVVAVPSKAIIGIGTGGNKGVFQPVVQQLPKEKNTQTVIWRPADVIYKPEIETHTLGERLTDSLFSGKALTLKAWASYATELPWHLCLTSD